MFHIVNVKRVVLSLLFRSYHRIWRLQFLIRRQSWPDILSAGEEVVFSVFRCNIQPHYWLLLLFNVYSVVIKKYFYVFVRLIKDSLKSTLQKHFCIFWKKRWSPLLGGLSINDMVFCSPVACHLFMYSYRASTPIFPFDFFLFFIQYYLFLTVAFTIKLITAFSQQKDFTNQSWLSNKWLSFILYYSFKTRLIKFVLGPIYFSIFFPSSNLLSLLLSLFEKECTNQFSKHTFPVQFPCPLSHVTLNPEAIVSVCYIK